MSSHPRAYRGAILFGMAAALALASQARAVAPSGFGVYFDTNGDGKCDSVLVRLDSTLQGSPRFRFTLCGSTWELDPSQMIADPARTIFSAHSTGISWDTGHSICTEVNLGSDQLSVIDSSSSAVLGTIQMTDRIPPILKSARFAPSEGSSPFDTLEIQTSEPITIDRSGGSLILRTAESYGAQVPYQVLVQTSRDHFFLFLQTGIAFLQTDSLRLSSFSVTDDYGNAPGLQTKWVPIDQPRLTTRLRRTSSLQHRNRLGTFDALGRTSPVQSKKIQLDGYWLPDVHFGP